MLENFDTPVAYLGEEITRLEKQLYAAMDEHRAGSSNPFTAPRTGMYWEPANIRVLRAKIASMSNAVDVLKALHEGFLQKRLEERKRMDDDSRYWSEKRAETDRKWKEREERTT